MGHNRSILNANDVDIQCIDGAIDIGYYDGVESGNAKSRVVCGYFLAILQPIRTFSPKMLQLLPLLFGGLLIGCVLLCFCVAEISGAVINNNCTILFH